MNQFELSLQDLPGTPLLLLTETKSVSRGGPEQSSGALAWLTNSVQFSPVAQLPQEEELEREGEDSARLYWSFSPSNEHPD